LLTFVLPSVIGVPIAAYNSYEAWNNVSKVSLHEGLPQTELDSIGKFPFPIGAVSDFENIFSEGQIERLSEIIHEYEQKTTRTQPTWQKNGE